jgi:hypothetical protein
LVPNPIMSLGPYGYIKIIFCFTFIESIKVSNDVENVLIVPSENINIAASSINLEETKIGPSRPS